MSAGLDIELSNYLKDLKRHVLFLDIERRIKNPVGSRSRPRSETLLSAYVSLSCGRFENFLQKAFFAAADDFRIRITKSNDPRIPKVDRFHRQNLEGFIKWAARVKHIPATDLATKISAYANAISGDGIFPASFEYTDANPNSKTLKDMFNRFGIDDPYGKIEGSYSDTLGRNLSATLIQTKLDNFVQRRHMAAHAGRVPNLTRVDVAEDHAFIGALGVAIHAVLKAHTSSVV